MIYVVTALHVVVCLFLIIVVLLQSGKAADLAGAFGGMGSQTAFGPRGSATVLSKATTVAAVLFMVTSLSLSIMATRRSGAASTILEKHSTAAPAPKKDTPAKGGASVQLPGLPAAPSGAATTAPATPAPAPAQTPEKK